MCHSWKRIEEVGKRARTTNIRYKIVEKLDENEDNKKTNNGTMCSTQSGAKMVATTTNSARYKRHRRRKRWRRRIVYEVTTTSSASAPKKEKNKFISEQEMPREEEEKEANERKKSTIRRTQLVRVSAKAQALSLFRLTCVLAVLFQPFGRLMLSPAAVECNKLRVSDYYASLPKLGYVSGAKLSTGQGYVAAFLGIPYANPPTGSLRLMPPSAPSSHSHVASAGSQVQDGTEQRFLMPLGQRATVRRHTHFGHQCVRLSDWLELSNASLDMRTDNGSSSSSFLDHNQEGTEGRTQPSEEVKRRRQAQSEDCLNLNVFIPINESGNDQQTSFDKHQIKANYPSQVANHSQSESYIQDSSSHVKAKAKAQVVGPSLPELKATVRGGQERNEISNKAEEEADEDNEQKWNNDQGKCCSSQLICLFSLKQHFKVDRAEHIVILILISSSPASP